MSIKLCQATGSTVTPFDDARLYSWITGRPVGIVTGCNVTSAGTNRLSISAGWGVCQGHMFTVAAETISAVLATSGTLSGRLLIRIDTADTDTPIKFVTQAAANLPALTQEDIDGSGSIYEIPLATYTAGTISVSNVTSAAPAASAFGLAAIGKQSVVLQATLGVALNTVGVVTATATGQGRCNVVVTGDVLGTGGSSTEFRWISISPILSVIKNVFPSAATLTAAGYGYFSRCDCLDDASQGLIPYVQYDSTASALKIARYTSSAGAGGAWPMSVVKTGRFTFSIDFTVS